MAGADSADTPSRKAMNPRRACISFPNVWRLLVLFRE
jgi:hypothetical protein